MTNTLAYRGMVQDIALKSLQRRFADLRVGLRKKTEKVHPAKNKLIFEIRFFFVPLKWRHDTRHNDILDKDIQLIDT